MTVAARLQNSCAAAACGGTAGGCPATPVDDDRYKTFVRYLDAALTAEDWQTFTTIWCKLPFCPTSGEADNRFGISLSVIPEEAGLVKPMRGFATPSVRWGWY